MKGPLKCAGKATLIPILCLLVASCSPRLPDTSPAKGTGTDLQAPWNTGKPFRLKVHHRNSTSEILRFKWEDGTLFMYRRDSGWTRESLLDDERGARFDADNFYAITLNFRYQTYSLRTCDVCTDEDEKGTWTYLR